MEIRILKYFLTAAREESISKAAAALHMTQPTLSRQLAQLEEETGVRLFQRVHSGIRLTEEGILLKRRAEEIIELEEKTVQELQSSDLKVEGTVAIGTGEISAVSGLADAIRSFRGQYPQITFSIYTATADQVMERMENGLLDIGLLMEPVNKENLEYIRLKHMESYAVVMKKDDPLAAKKSIRRNDLAGKPLIMPSRSAVQSELTGWFRDAYDTVNVPVTGNLVYNSIAMVAAGLGYAIAAGTDSSMVLPDHLTMRPLDPPVTAGTLLAWKAGLPQSHAVRKFIEHITCLSGMGEI